MPIIAQGAEAILTREGAAVTKKRVRKGYRLACIDESLRKSRTNREAKVLQKLEPLGFVPKLINTDKKTSSLVMEFIDGEKLSVHLEAVNWKKVCHEIGENVGTLHNIDIIHGDLTTSNMILKDKVYFIDFGLSFFSHRVEDRAVDLHVLKEALEAKHHTIWKKAFELVLSGYTKVATDSKNTLSRLDLVEARGRYKSKH